MEACGDVVSHDDGGCDGGDYLAGGALMTDIVERLRAPAYWFSGSSEGHEGENSAPLEAARTIEILRVELARINMENDRLTRTNRAKREHRDKLLQEIERLRAALREIDQQRYTERRTISTDNAYEIAMALNDTLLAVMKVARAALEGK